MYVVTGGAGFIGSNIVAALEERGHSDVVVVDKLRNENKWRNIGKRELRDIVSPENIFDYLNHNQISIDGIIHMGAISSTMEKDADLIFKTNFSLSLSLWKWCAINQVPFIYASSAATYGDGSMGFEDDESIEYLSRLNPLNAYGWSKNLFDRRITRNIANRKRVPPQWVGLKFFNVYGPNEYHKGVQKSVVSHVFDVAKDEKTFSLFRSHNPDYKDGEQMRDFVWVGDCVNVILWFLENRKVSGIFNIGSGEARSFLDLASQVYKSLGQEAKIGFVDTPESIRDKYQYYTKANISKLRKAGYDKPMTSLEDGVTEYVTKYLNASDQYR
ncbi:MAG: ADP-glyceromanno-heptose 6-epimerase [Alphaproteobacteria bacterium]